MRFRGEKYEGKYFTGKIIMLEYLTIDSVHKSLFIKFA